MTISNIKLAKVPVLIIKREAIRKYRSYVSARPYKQAKVIGRAVPYFENQLKKGSINKTPYS
ncbi:hypothetical protein [Herbaspirillum sp.]|uniref:hypothetical protein n=1 Tax=Herbaspirillum sp. TaxID=1890675 RepID=UPI0025845076|nr:hypothetical protein [Herbaspirillum sp.]MCP3949007.1 hypothetical protein [Herbaspirillum sp.]